MAVENITLNLIPTGDTPSIHVAQFDVERPFTVTLKEGTDDFTPTGYGIELQVRKVDNNIVTAIPASTSDNVVTFNTTEQMTACSGTNLAELQLSKDSQTFATLHFYLVVQRDVLAGGLSSQSEIYNLEEQIAAIVPEVIGDNYYDKTEVDALIAEHTFDPTNYYDKSDVDALLDDKADVSDLPDMTNYYDKSDVDALLDDKADVSDLPDMTNYYDKSETDALLDDKADVSDLPDMSNYYNKSEVDTKITDLYQIKTASGEIAHITDGGNDIPVKSLVSEIVAVESGSGTKSPTNPYTISGFDNGIITRLGKNFVNISGQTQASNFRIVPQFTRWNFPNGTYTFSCKLVTSSAGAVQLSYREDGTNKNVTKTLVSGVNNVSITLTTTGKVDIWSVYCNIGGTVSDIQLEVGDTASEFEQFNGNTYTFTFGQTVYGGHFDNKGNLVVTHNYIASYNGETINEPWVSSMDNYVPNTSPSTGAQVVYPLANPITLSITSQDIPTLSGENNIFSNCGDVEVEYFTEKSDGIAELIKAFM